MLSFPSQENLPSWATEVKLMLTLTATTAIVQMSVNLAPAMSASFVGRRLGVMALDGVSLAAIALNWICMSVVLGIMWASDTLAPQALGAGNKGEVGIVAFRAFVVSVTVALPLNVVVSFVLESFLVAIGEDPEASHLASGWYRIYLLSIPFVALYTSLWRFMMAQEKMLPVVVSAIFATWVVLPSCLHFLVGDFGYEGSAYAVVIFQISAAMSLFLAIVLFRPHDAPTWPGFRVVLAEWCDLKKLELFLRLAAGGVLAMSEWWILELIFAIVGTFGVENLSAHSIGANVTTIGLMIPLSIGGALTVRVGSTLPQSVSRSKSIAAWTLGVGMVYLILLAFALHVFRRPIYGLFTTSEAVMEICETIWIHVIVFSVVAGFYYIVMGVLLGIGKQLVVGATVLISLSLFGFPLFYFVSVVMYDRDLVVAWMTLSPPYLLIDIFLCWVFLSEDWNRISMEVKKRNEREQSQQDDSRALLPSTESTPLNARGV